MKGFLQLLEGLKTNNLSKFYDPVSKYGFIKGYTGFGSFTIEGKNYVGTLYLSPDGIATWNLMKGPLQIASGASFLLPNGFIRLSGILKDMDTDFLHIEEGPPQIGDVELTLGNDNKTQKFNGKIKITSKAGVIDSYIMPGEIDEIFPQVNPVTFGGSIDPKIFVVAGVVKKGILEGLDLLDHKDVIWSKDEKLKVAAQLGLAGAGFGFGIVNFAGAIGDALKL